LFADGRFDPKRCAAGFCGSAGAARPAERRLLAGLLADQLGPDCLLRVGNDAEVALAGALRSEEGYLLIAGTGSIAVARTRTGVLYRVGGWGHWLGDEGSAFWLALEAIKRGLHAFEGRAEPSGLLAAALDFFGLEDAQQLIPLFYGRFDKSAIALFAGEVEKHRQAGDSLAVALFEEAAAQLAGMVKALTALSGDVISNNTLSWHGGLLAGNDYLRAKTVALVQAACPGLEIVDPLGDGVAGACWLAANMIQGRN